MIVRSLEHWRSLPLLRIAEAAEIVGVCERTLENYLPEMTVREIGRLRFVTVESFRRWLGEDVPAERQAAAISAEVRREVRAWPGRR